MREHSGAETFHDVIIVGCGPTGATLACLLGLCGMSVLLLEKQAEAYPLPRAVHIDDETMRVFQTVGITENLRKLTRVNPGMRFVAPSGELLLDWPRPQSEGAHGWHASYRLHQPDLERELRTALKQFSHVRCAFGAEAVSVDDLGSHAKVVHRSREGVLGCARAAYAVGCDGANSIVRERSGIAMENLGFRQRWLVVDAILKRPKPELGDFSIQFCDPVRPATYCRNPGNRRRWEIALTDTDRTETFRSPDAAWEFIDRWISPGDADLERSAVYEFRSEIARDWRKGRLLLAGDAAHLTPPFMGQGLCAGIRDAANLAWKLAVCARGGGGELLDSYSSERAPHVRQYIETAVALGRLVNGDADAFKSAFADPSGGAKRMQSLKVRLGPGLTAAREDQRGQLFPQPRLAGGALLDERCGYAALLLAREELISEAGPGSSGRLFAVPVADNSPELRRCLDQLDARAALVRPDRYILGTAESASQFKELQRAAAKLFPADSVLNQLLILTVT